MVQIKSILANETDILFFYDRLFINFVSLSLRGQYTIGGNYLSQINENLYS